MTNAVVLSSFGRPGALSLDRPNRRRLGRALALSFVFHCFVLMLAFGGATGSIVSGGSGSDRGDIDAVTISLASLAGGEAGARPRDENQQLAFLYRKVLAADTELSASDRRQPPHEDLQKLLDAIDNAAGPSGAATGHERSDVGSEDLQAANSKGRTRLGKPDRAAPADGPGTAPTSGALWGEIEPCWRRLPGVSAVPVTLEITLDASGRIARPPRIDRPTKSRPDEQRLLSEARALAALAACVPYRAVETLGTRDFSIHFSATGTG